MSRRPHFWLHRSSRFWGGFLLLLILLGGWIYTCMDGLQFGRWRDRPGHFSSLLMSADRGSLGFSYRVNTEMGPLPAYTSPAGWYFDSCSKGAKLMPEFAWRSYHEGGLARKEFAILLPLWIPLLLWLPCWLLWMRRGDQKDDQLYGSAPALPAGENG